MASDISGGSGRDGLGSGAGSDPLSGGGGSAGHVGGGGRDRETFLRQRASRIKAPLGLSQAVPNIFAQQLTLPGEPGASYLPTDVTAGGGIDQQFGSGTTRNGKFKFSRRESLLLAN